MLTEPLCASVNFYPMLYPHVFLYCREFLFDFEYISWRLFQKRVVRTKCDIYIFINSKIFSKCHHFLYIKQIYNSTNPNCQNAREKIWTYMYQQFDFFIRRNKLKTVHRINKNNCWFNFSLYTDSTNIYIINMLLFHSD